MFKYHKPLVPDVVRQSPAEDDAAVRIQPILINLALPDSQGTTLGIKGDRGGAVIQRPGNISRPGWGRPTALVIYPGKYSFLVISVIFQIIEQADHFR